MPRGLDHIVHAVRDLDVAADLYRKLGFTVGARNRHPWGTHNHIVQFPGVFIELLTLAEPEKLSDDGFSKLFGAYTGDFLKRGDGLALLILQSHDAQADEASFRARGIAAAPAMRFEREGRAPDGEAVKVAFSLAFADDKNAPDIHFAVCQQHYPENFWNPAFQTHANSARGIAGVVMVADEPAAHRDFLLAFAGVESARSVGDGFAIDTPRGTIDTMTPVDFRRRFGIAAPDTSRGARLAAIRFALGETMAAAERGLQQAEVVAQRVGGMIVIGPAAALGATLVFEPTG
jgi:hypothetical protein